MSFIWWEYTVTLCKTPHRATMLFTKKLMEDRVRLEMEVHHHSPLQPHILLHTVAYWIPDLEHFDILHEYLSICKALIFLVSNRTSVLRMKSSFIFSPVGEATVALRTKSSCADQSDRPFWVFTIRSFHQDKLWNTWPLSSSKCCILLSHSLNENLCLSSLSVLSYSLNSHLSFKEATPPHPPSL